MNVAEGSMLCATGQPFSEKSVQQGRNQAWAGGRGLKAPKQKYSPSPPKRNAAH